jgi:hypothetical protein
MKNHIYQIYYSDATRARIDPGFLPLDNTGQRPDWFEYWPMRRFLRENTLDPASRYGFLSPKFYEKTSLTAEKLHAFLDTVPDDVDVVTFSPFFDQSAFFLNVFEHAAGCHPGIAPAIHGVLQLVAPGVNIAETIMSSAQSVFCNYLVAKPAFWQQWLETCERIFEVAEAGDTVLGQQLNADVRYENQSAPTKTFIIERMASLLLSTQPAWKVRTFNTMTLPIGSSALGRFAEDLMALDALKYMARETGFSQYFLAYLSKRNQLDERMKTMSVRHASI